MTDLDKLEALAAAATPGGVFGRFRSNDPADQLAQFHETLVHGAGPIWCVCVPVDDGSPIEQEALYTAITGNGPTSEANAKFYSVARENTLTLIEQVRALTTRVAELGAEVEDLKEQLAPDPEPSPARGTEGKCDGCRRPIKEGEQVVHYADDIVTHAKCPEPTS